MLAIGRALMTNPKMIIFGKAAEGLAPLIRNEIWRCLEGLRAQGQSIMVINKNVDALTRVGDHHYIIEQRFSYFTPNFFRDFKGEGKFAALIIKSNWIA